MLHLHSSPQCTLGMNDYLINEDYLYFETLFVDFKMFSMLICHYRMKIKLMETPKKIKVRLTKHTGLKCLYHAIDISNM